MSDIAKITAQMREASKPAPPLPKRSECDCPCHRPGEEAMHMLPCCEPDMPDDLSPFRIL